MQVGAQGRRQDCGRQRRVDMLQMGLDSRLTVGRTRQRLVVNGNANATGHYPDGWHLQTIIQRAGKVIRRLKQSIHGDGHW